MNLPLLFAFWGVVFVLIVVPGPDWAYTVGAGLRDRTVFPAVAGIVIGYLVLTAVVAAGVGAVVSRYPAVLTVLTMVGAAFLVLVGVTLLASRRGSRTEAITPAGGVASAPLRLLRGVGVSVLNPKGVLVFVALLPQFASSSAAWPFALQLAVLGMLFAATCAIFYTVLGLSARVVLRRRPGASVVISRVSGVAMIMIGVALCVERIIALGVGGP
jgi:threonine/homoserine/homoserine lactone efflux protein